MDNGFSKEEYAEAMNLFEENVLEPLLLTFVKSFKAGVVEIVNNDTKITEEEIKDSYICDFSTGYKPTFVIADKNGKIISKID